MFLGEIVFFGGLIKGEADLAGGVDRIWRTEFDEDKSMSFAEAEMIALRVGRLYEKLPPYEQGISLAWLNSLVERFVPVLATIGVIRRPVYPTIKVVHFTEAYDWKNARARTENCSPVLEFSDRLFDPADPWSRQPARAMAGVAHEIIHPQQGEKLCKTASFVGNDLLAESSADIASLEAQAYAYYHGFPEAAFGFLARLRESSLAAALVLAAMEGRATEGGSLIDRLALDNLERESLAEDFKLARMIVKASRGGHGRGGDQGEMNKNRTLSLLVHGIRENQGQLTGLLLSPIGGYKEPADENVERNPRPFRLSYTSQFIANTEAIVAGM